MTEFTTTLPNIPADSVPVGVDEDAMWKFAVGVLHASLISNLKLTGIWVKNLGILTGNVDGKVTGARFLFYKGLGARLERGYLQLYCWD